MATKKGRPGPLVLVPAQQVGVSPSDVASNSGVSINESSKPISDPNSSVELRFNDSNKNYSSNAHSKVNSLSLVRNSTGPIDAEEVQRHLKEQQDLEEGQRLKLIEFVQQKRTIDELCQEQLVQICELGKGNGGVVTKVKHEPSNLIMARKNILLDIKPAIRNQIIRELQILHDCNSPYIIGFYGAFFHGNNISICMEYMNAGSLDLILENVGRLPEPIISRICFAVLRGLKYLRESLKTIHRDVKPSNILVNLEGEVKLCDFGVSGNLIDSLAQSFVGTRSYMSPERINGQEYTIRSDVWSLGLSLVELASGRYPIPPPEMSEYLTVFSGPNADANIYQHEEAALNGLRLPALRSRGTGSLAIFELLSHIVDTPPPALPECCFSPDFPRFVDICLKKDPSQRLTPDELLQHSFVSNNGGGAYYSLEINMANYLRPLMTTSDSSISELNE